MNHIVLCLDGSAYGRSVCDHAGWLAGRLNASVELVHALDLRERPQADPHDFSGSLGVQDRQRLLAELVELDHARHRTAQQLGRKLLEQGQAVLKEAGIAETTTMLRNGGLVDVLQEVEGRADLIVLGKRGEGMDVASGHLGSNLERVVRASSRPCLVAARAFRPIRRVLVAFDGGRSARRAVSFLAESGGFKDLDVQLVMVSGTPESPAVREAMGWARDVLASAGFAPACRVLPGNPEEVIANTVSAEKMDLLVMGAYGHSRIRTLIIGSTTTAMIRDCRIPVLLFR